MRVIRSPGERRKNPFEEVAGCLFGNDLS